MIKYLKNERGLTLIELLAASVLTLIISVFAFNLLSKGIDHYNTIATDTAFRDEADILMSSLLRELYTTKESEITKLELPENSTKNYYLEIYKDGNKKKTGFINNELFIRGEKVSTTNTSIVISNDSFIENVEDGLYQVRLVLKMPSKNQVIGFDNQIRTINDLQQVEED